MTRTEALDTIVALMDRADLLELGMMDLTFACGALGMINDEQFGIMQDWAADLRIAWLAWVKVRNHTSEKMWTNMALLQIGDTREFTALKKATKEIRRIWKRRPLGLTV